MYILMLSPIHAHYLISLLFVVNRLHTVNPILLYFLLLFSQHVNELFCTPYSYRVAEDGLSYWPGYREVLRDNFQTTACALRSCMPSVIT
jgi:hypothetical protein